MQEYRKYRNYIFVQPEVKFESHHRSLSYIIKKWLCQISLHLQRMPFVLQMYPIIVKCKPGNELFLADALSPCQAHCCSKRKRNSFKSTWWSALQFQMSSWKPSWRKLSGICRWNSFASTNVQGGITRSTACHRKFDAIVTIVNSYTFLLALCFVARDRHSESHDTINI